MIYFYINSASNNLIYQILGYIVQVYTEYIDFIIKDNCF